MKSTLTLFIVAGLLCAALAVGNQAKDDRSEVALQAAIKKETIDGDLRRAIDQYRKLAQSSNRVVAAKALVRMGQCYERLGDTEARKAYERVVREFADQKDSAAEARKRLAGSSASADTGLTERRAWSPPEDGELSSPSPDGRYILAAGWPPEDKPLLLHDFITGEDRTVFSKSQCWDSIVLSPDAKLVGCKWKVGNDDWEFRVFGVGGSSVRKLLDVKGRWNHMDDWSLDGRYILARLANRTRLPFDLVLISVADSSVRVLKAGVRAIGAGGARFSPDGKYIAFPVARSGPDGKPVPPDGNRMGTIHIMATDGNGEVPLVQGPHTERHWNPTWAPDGRTIVFLSDRSGTVGVWAVRVLNGKPQGDPELLKPNTPDISLDGFASDGSFYYSKERYRADVFVAAIDPDSGKVISARKRVNQTNVGSSAGPLVWSPDGKSLAFTTFNKKLVVRSMQNGDERELSQTPPTPVAWFPGGQALLAAPPLSRIDLNTGEVRLFAKLARATPQWNVALSHDGRSAFYFVNDSDCQKNDGRCTWHLLRQNLETGEEQEVFQTKSPQVSQLSLSADDRHLAFIVNPPQTAGAVLTVTPTIGGNAREVYSGPTRGLAWTNDGRHLVIGGGMRPDGKWRLLSVPLDGGEVRATGLFAEQPLSLHPDGRQVAFADIDWQQEVWVVKNLLSQTRSGR